MGGLERTESSNQKVMMNVNDGGGLNRSRWESTVGKQVRHAKSNTKNKGIRCNVDSSLPDHFSFSRTGLSPFIANLEP